MFTCTRFHRGKGAARARLTVEQLEDRTVPALLGQELFPADNPWNQQIAAAPVASNSQAIMDNIVARYGNGRLHPDFGQDYRNGNDLYGIPFNVVHGNSQAKVRVVINAYPDESDIVDAPIPLNAVLEGDLQNGPRVGLNNRGDSHLLVWDVDNNIAYEFYRASRPSENADGRWHADQETVWDMKTNTFRTLGWTSADAAGLSILAGLVRPDEALPVSQGGQGVINHAIRFTLQNSIILQQYLYPASHVANPGNTNVAVQPPMGARFRLKAGVDISALNPQSKIVAQAMKDYGMIVADNGSNFFFSGASYSVNASNQFTLTWNDNDVQDSTRGLKSLHYSDFEVVDLTPIVTNLSVHAGSAGAEVTVIGQNFSGSAGHLEVLFGDTPASSVTFVDDSHLLAVVPNGSGTVGVRVQSGIDDPNDPYNYKGSIFGYGISAISANGQFSYDSSPGNQAPTVEVAAAATPQTVAGTTTDLSVLGADDAGEANLRYTWVALQAPSGASPIFSVNGSNTAKNTTVTFNRAGAYVFQVTIVDAGGLSATSNVAVSVSQTLSAVTIAPAAAAVKQGKSRQFSATAVNQFNQPLTNQPNFSWSMVSGPGTISSAGLYQAPRQGTGTAVVRATAGDLSADAVVTIIASRPRRAGDLRGQSQSADVNGDGRADVIFQTKSNAFWAWLGTSGGSSSPTKIMQHGGSYVAGQAQYADVNGDGRDDLIYQGRDNAFYLSLANGTTLGAPHKVAKHGGSFVAGQAQFADINGDGGADLIFQSSSNAFWLSLSTGTAFAAAQKVAQPGGSFRAGQARYADVNGDGRDDLVFQSNSAVWLYRSSGNTVAAPVKIAQPGGSLLPGQVQFADADGDGLADLLFQGLDNSFWLYRAGADGFSSRQQIAKHGGSFRAGQAQYADVNGDGLADLIFQTNSNAFWLSLSVGTRYEAPKKVAQHTGTFQPGRALFADVNGDGLDDLIVQQADGSLWQSLSSGAALSAAVKLPAPV